jgi:hypothetical protein
MQGKSRLLARLLLLAGAFALTELVAGLSIGQFAERGRAEVAIFLAFRPWLLILLVVAAMRRPAGERWSLYVISILLAGASEALLVHMLGAPSALIESARSAAASLALILLLDVTAMVCARLPGWRGAAVAALVGLVLILVPGPLALYERIALRGEPAPPPDRPALTLLTGLPLVWGEANAAYEALSAAYTIRPIDAATPERLGPAKLLLVAQTRPPGPAGLVALDAWVRGGGRALILTDPDLRWPSDLALGDPRRPPADDGLAPLLAHWGLSVEAPKGRVLVTRDIEGRRIAMAAPGRFVALGSECAIGGQGLFAACRPGSGRALLMADADLLHDLLWTGPGAIGTKRAGRLADNAALIIQELGELEGRVALAGSDRVDWITQPDSFDSGVLAAFAVPGSSFLLGLILLIGGRRASAKKDSDRLIHRQ